MTPNFNEREAPPEVSEREGQNSVRAPVPHVHDARCLCASSHYFGESRTEACPFQVFDKRCEKPAGHTGPHEFRVTDGWLRQTLAEHREGAP